MTDATSMLSAGSVRGPRSRNFILFAGSRGAASLGDTMAPIALAAGMVQNGFGAGAIGAAMAAMTACFAGFVVFGGVISDRVSTRSLMVTADLVRVVTQGILAALFFSGHVVLWQICALAAINGICAALFQPGVASTIPRIVDDVQRANATIRTVESVMLLAGPVVAGILVGTTQAAGVFVAHASTYLLSAACLGSLRLSRVAVTDTGRNTFRSDLIQGWREFRSRAWLWGVIAIITVWSLAAGGPTVPLLATEVITEHGPGAYSVINVAMGIGMVIGGLLATRFRPARPLRAGSLALVTWAVTPIAVGLMLPLPLLAAALAVSGGVNVFWGVMWATSVQTHIPGEVLNRVHAYEVAGSLAMVSVGQALAGPAAHAFTARAVLLTSAVVGVTTALALLSVPAIRGLRRIDHAAARPG